MASDKTGGTLVRSGASIPAGAPPYLTDAYKDIGIQEWVLNSNKKKISNPLVERYIEKVSGSPANAMTTPWCAYFVGAKLEYAGYTSTKSGMARSYLNWGSAVQPGDWKAGDIVVFMRGDYDDHTLGHVAFLISWDDRYVTVLGGNQGDKVCIERNLRSRILGVRRPRSFFASKTTLSAAGSATTNAAAKVVSATVPDTPTHIVNAVGMPVDANTLAPTVMDKLPSPDDLQSAYDQAHPYLAMFQAIKPELVVVLTLASMVLAGYTIYYRYLDWNKGRT